MCFPIFLIYLFILLFNFLFAVWTEGTLGFDPHPLPLEPASNHNLSARKSRVLTTRPQNLNHVTSKLSVRVGSTSGTQWECLLLQAWVSTPCQAVGVHVLSAAGKVIRHAWASTGTCSFLVTTRRRAYILKCISLPVTPLVEKYSKYVRERQTVTQDEEAGGIL